MPKKRHKPEKIVARLRQGEAFAFTGAVSCEWRTEDKAG